MVVSLAVDDSLPAEPKSDNILLLDDTISVTLFLQAPIKLVSGNTPAAP